MFNAQSIVVLRERLKVSSVCYEVITFSILHNILPGPLPGLALKAVKCSRKMELAFSVVLGDFPHSQHKLLECLALHRISPTVEDLLSPDQAGFRKGRSTCDQVAALTTFIENGFQQNLSKMDSSRT